MNSPVVKNLSQILESDYIVETSSGTAALIAALKINNFSTDSEVIIPSVTCPAVMSAVNFSNLKPVFADMENNFFNMDIENIKKLINKKTVCIVGVHCFGISADINELRNICEKNEILLIEDCCLAFGTKYEGSVLGTFGDISIFSFGYDKLISGAGGALVLKNKKDFLKALDIISSNSLFQVNEYKYQDIENQFDALESTINLRNQNALKFSNFLSSDKVIIPSFRSSDVYWRYPSLFLGDRDKLIKKSLENKTIITSHYPALSKFQFNTNLENADFFDKSLINFFVNKSATDEYIEKIIELVNNG